MLTVSHAKVGVEIRIMPFIFDQHLELSKTKQHHKKIIRQELRSQMVKREIRKSIKV